MWTNIYINNDPVNSLTHMKKLNLFLFCVNSKYVGEFFCVSLMGIHPRPAKHENLHLRASFDVVTVINYFDLAVDYVEEFTSVLCLF